MSQNPKKRWMVHAKRADFNGLSDLLGIDKVAVRVLVNRGVDENSLYSFVNPSKNDFIDPKLLLGSKEAVSILKKVKQENKRVRIVGDYDIDGICATYILKKCLNETGIQTDYYLPKRIEDGYGMNERIVEKAHSDGIDVLITVDNGISALSAVLRAKELGLTVIVTDHHEVPKDDEGKDILPDADVVINPKRSDCTYPYKEICGTVVAWKVAACLYEAFGYDENKNMECLEFAAFGTIGDIMKLHNENRAIVSLGLKKMIHTKNIGLQMLIESCNLGGKRINTYHVGFVLGPCLNAGGRLSDASLGVELFDTEDRDKAFDLAEKLRLLNEERKDMTLKGTQEAVNLIEEQGYNNDKIIVAYVPGIHESLCGIIAGRLKEKYYRPSFMLTDGENYVKGSGRSILGYNMFENMNRNKELFLMYGGHPMAAGLSIKRENIDKLRQSLNRDNTLKDEDLIEKVMIDTVMPLGYITKQLIEDLDKLEPFGNGNEKPIFATKKALVHRIYCIGKSGEYLKIILKDNGTLMEALLFSNVEEFSAEVDQGTMIDVLYYPQINEYRGEESLQIIISDYKVSDLD